MEATARTVAQGTPGTGRYLCPIDPRDYDTDAETLTLDVNVAPAA
jgi:hypothetical protein